MTDLLLLHLLADPNPRRAASYADALDQRGARHLAELVRACLRREADDAGGRGLLQRLWADPVKRRAIVGPLADRGLTRPAIAWRSGLLRGLVLDDELDLSGATPQELWQELMATPHIEALQSLTLLAPWPLGTDLTRLAQLSELRELTVHGDLDDGALAALAQLGLAKLQINELPVRFADLAALEPTPSAVDEALKRLAISPDELAAIRHELGEQVLPLAISGRVTLAIEGAVNVRRALGWWSVQRERLIAHRDDHVPDLELVIVPEGAIHAWQRRYGAISDIFPT